MADQIEFKGTRRTKHREKSARKHDTTYGFPFMATTTTVLFLYCCLSLFLTPLILFFSLSLSRSICMYMFASVWLILKCPARWFFLQRHHRFFLCRFWYSLCGFGFDFTSTPSYADAHRNDVCAQAHTRWGNIVNNSSSSSSHREETNHSLKKNGLNGTRIQYSMG